MTAAEQQMFETAGERVGDAFNVMHWAILRRAAGEDFEQTRQEALEQVRKAERVLAGAEG